MSSVPERDEIDEEHKWDIESLYQDKEEWESDREEVEKLVEKIAEFEGEVAESPGKLFETLEIYENIRRKLSSLSRYASMKSDEDTRKQEYQKLSTRADALSAKVSSTTSFIEPEIQDLSEEEFQHMVEQKPKLEKYKHHVKDILRVKPHTRSKEVEEVLSDLGEVLGAPGEIYQMLSDADMEFPTVEKPSGEEVEISSANFTKLLQHQDRDFRQKVHEKFYDEMGEVRNTIGSTLANSTRTHVKTAKIRGYDTSRAAALDPSNIPVEVYDNLVDVIRDNLGLLHRHAELKKKSLDADELKTWDLYMPLADSESPEISFEEAKSHVVQAVSVLGEEYREKVEEALESEGWVDVYENKGKRSGAYSGGSYESKPFILMNFQDDINSMYTLAHELGHSMHSHYANNNQPYIYSGYEIFVAEVASTVNEALLTHHLLETVEDENFRRHILSHYLERFRSTIYRQTMFAEFEHRIHAEIEDGGALTPDYLDEEYRELKSEFYEPVAMDDRIAREWMRIPHFYYNFYVFQYSTGMSAATAISSHILEEGESSENARERYIEFLKKGGSEYPLQLLQDAGVNMNSSKPIKEALEVYEEYLEKMEKLV
jgi:oligoendopeptidase F